MIVKGPSVENRKYTTSLLILASILLGISIVVLVPAATVRGFFTSVVLSIATAVIDTSCLRVASTVALLITWQTVLYPLGALRSATRTLRTFCSLLIESLSPNVSTPVASNNTGSTTGRASGTALRVISWSVVNFR